jgi:hypothetical protein
MFEYELRQAGINDTHYRATRELIEQARRDGIPFVEAGLETRIKTTMTRLINQVKRLSAVSILDPDFELLKQVRAQNINRVRELLVVWEPIEKHHRRLAAAARRERAVKPRRPRRAA